MFLQFTETEKKIYVVGHKGKVQGVFMSAVEALESGKHPTPILEFDMSSVVSPDFQLDLKIHVSDFPRSEELIKEVVEKWYAARGIFGPYGDVLQLNWRLIECEFPHKSHSIYTVDFIGRRAFHKPGLAADIVPFVVDEFGNVFMVAIKRGKNPGKGKIALAGGFCDIHGFHKETGAETAIREAGEEIGLKIYPRDEEVCALQPNAPEIFVRIELENYVATSRMHLLGTFQTSSEECLNNLGLKRIYETTAYMLVIPMKSKNALLPSEVAAMFIAGDDAAEIVAIRASDVMNIDFAFEHHHNICQQAMDRIAETLLGSITSMV